MLGTSLKRMQKTRSITRQISKVFYQQGEAGMYILMEPKMDKRDVCTKLAAQYPCKSQTE